ncbi:MAG: 4-alpha-glucanotransferase [bacterium]
MSKRSCGILLHISSLPSSYGIGDLGPEAYRFADFLSRTKQSLWQILPLNGTLAAGNNSPYHSMSAFAGNPLLISPDKLVEDGLLTKENLEPVPDFPIGRVNYSLVASYKDKILNRAFERHEKTDEYHKFCLENKEWLEDFSLFKTLKSRFSNRVWSEWPKEIRDRNKDALRKLSKELSQEMEKEKFLQYLFYQQWFLLKQYCNQKGIRIFGDMAIYTEHDSVDVWKNTHLFKLDKNRNPAFVSGVPPDYFSKTGQLWGHPVYNWQAVKRDGFDWWIKRVAQNLRLYDLVRIDHFRGLVAYWEVKAGESTAIHGEWINAMPKDLLSRLKEYFPEFPVIAEDLGIITPDVTQVMNEFGIPGMRVLLFAFGEDNPGHPYLPENFVPKCIVYTGTHDTNTARGWFEKEASDEDKERLFRYLGKNISSKEVAWELIRLAMDSVAETAVIPMQDILGLGEKARMNRPALSNGNWLWRLRPGEIGNSLTEKWLKITESSHRAS